MPTSKAILDAFQRLGWRGHDPMSLTLQLRRQNPEALTDLVAGAMVRALPNFESVVGAALDLMDDASFDKVALWETGVELFPTPARWTHQDWGVSNDRQNLNRAGGAPSWIQSAWYPECPDCGRRMSFVMQLDSNLPQDEDREWLWGSGGLNYTYWCAACRISAHLWQCT